MGWEGWLAKQTVRESTRIRLTRGRRWLGFYRALMSNNWLNSSAGRERTTAAADLPLREGMNVGILPAMIRRRSADDVRRREPRHDAPASALQSGPAAAQLRTPHR